MLPNTKKNETTLGKSNRILGMTASQIAILSVLGCFALLLFVVLAGLFLSNTNSLPNIQPVAPVSNPTSSLPTHTPQLSTTAVDNYIVGTWLDDWAVPCTITIKRINGSYQMTRLYRDGSGETKTLTVQIVDGIERLIEHPNSPAGDYMVIENRNLVFYDNEGFIYAAYPNAGYPEKLDTLVPTSTRTPKPTSTPTSVIIMLQGGDIGRGWFNDDYRMSLLSVYRTESLDGVKPFGEWNGGYKAGFTQFLVVELQFDRFTPGFDEYEMSGFWLWAYTDDGYREYQADQYLYRSSNMIRVNYQETVREIIAFEVTPESHNFIMCYHSGIMVAPSNKILRECGSTINQFKFGD